MILSIDFKFQTNQEIEDFALLICTVIIVIALSILAFYLSMDRYKNAQWKKGVFPYTKKYSNETLYNAYLSLSASMIRRNLDENTQKFKYINSFFNKNFPETKADFKPSFNFALRYPLKLNTICDWLNDNVLDEVEKLRIIYFLAGVSMVNGTLNNEEYRLLQYLVELLHLKEKDLDSIIAMYHAGNKNQKKSSKTKSNSRNQKTKINECYKILGVTSESTVEEIKKSYRKLAMKNHPDKFEQEGIEKLRLAVAQFLKIQEAYEYLIKMKH
jgi:DnaJ like chaperone protein